MIPHNSILLSGGLVFDGEGNAPIQADILIQGSRLTIGPNLVTPPETRTVSLAGLCVSPGWIDLHTHVFRSNGIFSLSPDTIGLRSGVTTLVDAGSAGAFHYRAFFENVIRTSQETILAYVNVANTGIVHGHAGREGFVGDHVHRSLYDPAPALALLQNYAASIVGWKARLSAALVNHDHELELHAFHQLCRLRDQGGLPLMVHHVKSTVSPDHLMADLVARDVYTHLYHGCEDSIFDGATGRPSDAAWRARERGVVFDVGHGSGAFTWACAEKACLDHGFWPDTISSDLHRYNVFWPVADLATTMTKFLFLGASVEQVIAMVTGNVRRAIDRPLGTFNEGAPTDLTIFSLEQGEFSLSDVHGVNRTSNQRFLPLATIKGGEITPCSAFAQSPFMTGKFAQSIQNAAAY